MLATRPPISGHRLPHAPKTARRPLQSVNQSTTVPNHPKSAQCVEIFQFDFDTSNKENIPPFYSTPLKEEPSPIEPIDASIADELNAIREKLERLRIDRGKTDILLRERGLIMDLEMKEIVERGEIQKELEIEVDRLYRLKEIKLACMNISRIRSLRDREEEKKMKLNQMNIAHIKAQDSDAGKDKSPLQSPNSQAQSWN